MNSSEESIQAKFEENLYQYALSYAKAANLLNPMRPMAVEGSIGATMIPYIVLLAFTVELHLKVFAAICGMNKKQVRSYGHKYSDLYIAAVQLGKKNSVPGINNIEQLSLEHLLTDISRQFTETRYGYELPPDKIPVATRPSRIVLTAIRSVLIVARPNWPQLLEHSSQL